MLASAHLCFFFFFFFFLSCDCHSEVHLSEEKAAAAAAAVVELSAASAGPMGDCLSSDVDVPYLRPNPTVCPQQLLALLGEPPHHHTCWT